MQESVTKKVSHLDDDIKTELLQSTIELNTSVCEDVQGVQRDLEALKAIVAR